jgi:hypothetical protein
MYIHLQGTIGVGKRSFAGLTCGILIGLGWENGMPNSRVVAMPFFTADVIEI